MVTRLAKAKKVGSKTVALKKPLLKSKTKTPVKNSTAKKQKIDAQEFDNFVKTRAYYLWKEQGQPQEKEMELWLQAEKEIKSKYAIA